MAVTPQKLSPSTRTECRTCHKPIPVGLANLHHVIPQATGGVHGPTEFLCPNCHDTVHRAAEKILKGDLAAAEDMMTVLYPSPVVRRSIYGLASIVAREMNRKRQTKVGLDDTTVVQVQIELPRNALARLKTLASDMRDPRTGRRVGVAKYIRQVVAKHLADRGLWAE